MTDSVNVQLTTTCSMLTGKLMGANPERLEEPKEHSHFEKAAYLMLLDLD